MQPGGKACFHNSLEHARFKFQGTEGKAGTVFASVQRKHGQSCRNKLGNHRGVSNACHAPSKFEDEYKIQDYIQHSRYNQKIEGPFRVAYRTQNARAGIVKHLEQDAEKVYTQILLRKLETLGRHLHQVQESRTQAVSSKSKNNTKQKG